MRVINPLIYFKNQAKCLQDKGSGFFPNPILGEKRACALSCLALLVIIIIRIGSC